MPAKAKPASAPAGAIVPRRKAAAKAEAGSQAIQEKRKFISDLACGFRNSMRYKVSDDCKKARGYICYWVNC